MKKKLTAIVLGGTNSHAELIKNLKRRGYYTVLVDYTKNPPAKMVADEHLEESALDLCSVERIARSRAASLVITAALDQPLPIAINVSGALGLPRPFDDAVAHSLTNKAAMKNVMEENQIPTPRWRRIDSHEVGAGPPFPLPVIVKPEDGTGSRGITILHDEGAFQDAVAHARGASRNGRVMVEEFVSGRELSVDCVVADGEARVVLCKERFKMDQYGGAGGLQCVASVVPANLNDHEHATVCALMTRICAAFGIREGVMLVQAILKGTGELSVLETAGRVNGGTSGFITAKRKAGVDLIDCVVRSFLGQPIESTVGDDGRHYASGSLYCSEGVFGSITGADELLSRGVVVGLLPYKAPGYEIPAGFSTKNRVAGFTVSGESRDGLRENLLDLFNSVDVLDPSGQSLLLRHVGIHRIL